jgi:hypothetical protein
LGTAAHVGRTFERAAAPAAHGSDKFHDVNHGQKTDRSPAPTVNSANFSNPGLFKDQHVIGSAGLSLALAAAFSQRQ